MNIVEQIQESIEAASQALYADTDHRRHLGASVVGSSCKRQSHFIFRWVGREKFDGRMLRLFNRGHLEEERVKSLLATAGYRLHMPSSSKQYRVSAIEGHFGGSLDGAVEVNGKWYLAEFKTANRKNFMKMKKDGVVSAKFEHFVQMQTYMHLAKLEGALYFCVNKDDDEIYVEEVHAQPDYAEKILAKGREIIYYEDTTPIAGVSDSPSFWVCKMCNFYDNCHGEKFPEKNCRTCIHAAPIDGGRWACRYDRDEINSQIGCEAWLVSPMLLPSHKFLGGHMDASDWRESVLHLLGPDEKEFTLTAVDEIA